MYLNASGFYLCFCLLWCMPLVELNELLANENESVYCLVCNKLRRLAGLGLKLLYKYDNCILFLQYNKELFMLQIFKSW